MKQVRLCFQLAVVSACASLMAAGFAMAETYQNMYCMSTPIPVCSSNPCGCPTSEVHDFCSDSKPIPGGTEIINYYCVGGFPMTCTSPSRSCGGEVYVCACWKCDSSCTGCPGETCTLTSKVNFCTGTHGCSS